MDSGDSTANFVDAAPFAKKQRMDETKKNNKRNKANSSDNFNMKGYNCGDSNATSFDDSESGGNLNYAANKEKQLMDETNRKKKNMAYSSDYENGQKAAVTLASNIKEYETFCLKGKLHRNATRYEEIKNFGEFCFQKVIAGIAIGDYRPLDVKSLRAVYELQKACKRKSDVADKELVAVKKQKIDEKAGNRKNKRHSRSRDRSAPLIRMKRKVT